MTGYLEHAGPVAIDMIANVLITVVVVGGGAVTTASDCHIDSN